MLERFVELKEEFLKKRNRWAFFMVDYMDDIKVVDKTVYMLIRSEREDSEKNRQVDISFFYCTARARNDLINFRDGLTEFKKLVRNCGDWDFKLNNINVNYGSTPSLDTIKDSLRVAEIQVTYDLIERSEKLDKEYEYELMQKLYLNLNEGGNSGN